MVVRGNEAFWAVRAGASGKEVKGEFGDDVRKRIASWEELEINQD
jgi:hypothetical protein